MSEPKKKRGRPSRPLIGPKLPDGGRGDLPNPRAPYCNQLYKDPRVKNRTEYLYCGKKGRHLKHGNGSKTRWK